MAYSPAENVTYSAGLAHLAMNMFYRRKALDQLTKKTIFHTVAEKDTVSKQSGRTISFWRYSNMSANTTPSTEGSVGTSLTTNSRMFQALLSQYTSFINVSDFVQLTAPDDLVQKNAELLGYRGALTVDTILRNVIDAESSSTNQAALGSSFTARDLKRAYFTLTNSDMLPFENGNMKVIMSPLVAYDLLDDPGTLGLADIFKHGGFVGNSKVFTEGVEDRGKVATISNCDVTQSTNVYSSGSTYRTYVFAKGGVGCADLESRSPSMVSDIQRERFKVNVIAGGPDKSDPEGIIGGQVSYNFVFTGVVLDTTNYRYKTIDVASTIA